jgi:hypothetical protein
MQHSADFASLLVHHAGVARAEREIELRRAADERRSLSAEAATEVSVRRSRHARRASRLATR